MRGWQAGIDYERQRENAYLSAPYRVEKDHDDEGAYWLIGPETRLLFTGTDAAKRATLSARIYSAGQGRYDA